MWQLNWTERQTDRYRYRQTNRQTDTDNFYPFGSCTLLKKNVYKKGGWGEKGSEGREGKVQINL